MFDYKLLEALAMVADEKGFDNAAEKLYITQSAVSQRIKLLEEQSGQILITRMTPPQPTDMGKKLITHYHQVKLMENEVNRAILEPAAEYHTRITIGLNADSLDTWFMKILKPYLDKEKILIELKVDDQDQTSSFLKNGEVAGCISSRDKSIQGCGIHHLGKMEYTMVCTPEFYQIWFSDGFSLQNVEKTPSVVFNRKDKLHSISLDNYFHKIPEKYPIHYVPASEPFLSMILMNQAYGVVPLIQCKDLLSEGRIMEIHKKTIDVSLYWHHWNIKTRQMELLTELLINKCREFLK